MPERLVRIIRPLSGIVVHEPLDDVVQWLGYGDDDGYLDALEELGDKVLDSVRPTKLSMDLELPDPTTTDE